MPPRPFLTVVEPPAQAGGDLPRMDVAAFAGFAEAGPFGTPVCVESPAAFAAIFGGPLVLPGGPGHLRDAIDAFFAGGGRRAWVLRAGDPSQAQPDLFPLPGVLAVGPGGALRAAMLAARSSGTFAAEIRLAAAPRRERIIVTTTRDSITVIASDGSVTDGDLVELPVRKDERQARRFAVLQPSRREDGFGLSSLLTVSDPQPLTGDLGGRCGRYEARLERDRAGARLRLMMPLGGRSPVAVGELVRFRPDRAAAPHPAPRVAPEPDTWMLVCAISAPQPSQGGPGVVLTGPVAHVETGAAGWTLTAGTGAVVTLDLAGRRLNTNGATWRADRLACTRRGTTWPGLWPDDHTRYEGTTGPVAPAALPVCGTSLATTAALVPVFQAPFGVDASPIHPTRDPAARNGAAGDPARLLVAGMRERSIDGLRQEHDARSLVERPGPPPGITGLLDAQEATLFTVPDAVVPGPAPVTRDAASGPRALPALRPADDRLGGFGSCPAPPRPPTPGEALVRLGGSIALTWLCPDERDAAGSANWTYEVGLFADPGTIAPSRLLYGGPAEVVGTGRDTDDRLVPVRGVTLAGGVRGYARVRSVRADGRASTWSSGARLPLMARPETPHAGTADLAAVQDVHAVLMRLAAVRGDTLAILALPPNTTDAEARAHTEALQRRLGARAEGSALASGTLAHPWPRFPAPLPAVSLPAPADGVLAGQLAAMAVERGAWIAVSDRPISDAIDTTDTAADSTSSLANRYRVGPRGVAADGQATLALDPDARPVNVRRLLATIRRAAIERGRRTVFEPNGPVLWRSLHRDLEALLALLHVRGAFQPAAATDAYRLNVHAGSDAQCVCEIRVAPSRPLRFLTVRLERSGDGTITASGS